MGEWRLPIAAALALAGCDHDHDAAIHATGRFQMVQSQNEHHAVYVIDTQTGTIWLCQESLHSKPDVLCGTPAVATELGHRAP